MRSIRLLFELSSYVTIGIPLVHQVLPMCRLLWKVHVNTFSIPLKNDIDQLFNIKRNYDNFSRINDIRIKIIIAIYRKYSIQDVL